jgi:crossover junction endodeoxyribonuclease RuvC
MRGMGSCSQRGAAPVRVLGIDPGTRVAGYAVLDLGRGPTPTLVRAGAFRLPDGPIPARLLALHEGILDVIREDGPTVLAVETIFHGKSFPSVAKVSEARGVVLLAAAQYGLEIAEFQPALVKKAATGNGTATKRQVQSMMVRILGLTETPRPIDATDAIAIAFCYGQRLWRRPRLERSDRGRAGLDELARSTRAEQRRKWNQLLARAALQGKGR